MRSGILWLLPPTPLPSPNPYACTTPHGANKRNALTERTDLLCLPKPSIVLHIAFPPQRPLPISPCLHPLSTPPPPCSCNPYLWPTPHEETSTVLERLTGHADVPCIPTITQCAKTSPLPLPCPSKLYNSLGAAYHFT